MCVKGRAGADDPDNPASSERLPTLSNPPDYKLPDEERFDPHGKEGIDKDGFATAAKTRENDPIGSQP